MPKVKYSGMGNNSRGELQQERNETRTKYKDFEGSEDNSAERTYFKKDFDSWWDGLSKEERDGIVTYTGHSYEQINQYLRNGEMGSGNDSYIEQIINNAYDGLKQFKLTSNLKLYRQSDTSLFSALTHLPKLTYSKDSMEAWVNAMNGYRGTTVTDKGFTSTSTRNDVWGGSVYMEIRAPKGTNGAYVEPISLHSSEREFILNRGTHFKIVGARVDRTEHGGYRPVVIMQIVKR